MRRKIEKYLAEKAGVDESAIETSEDGRYDFKGDLEGVLAAVRSDGHSNGLKGASRILNSDSRPSRFSMSMSHESNGGDSKYVHHAMPPNPYYPYPYPPHYPMGSFPPMSNMYHLPPHMGKENVPLFPSMPPYWAMRNPMAANPPHKSRTTLHSSPRSGGPHNYLLSAKKSIFDSPPPNQDIKSCQNGPPSPPMTDFKDTFATPLAPHNESSLSQEEVLSLNKTLFTEDVMSTPFCGPPSVLSAPIRISIGCDDNPIDFSRQNMSLNNRVTISPMQGGVRSRCNKANFFDDDEELSKSVLAVMQKDDLDKEMMPPPTLSTQGGLRSTRKNALFTSSLMNNQTPKNMSGALTPFDSGKMAQHLTTTPSTVATTTLDESSFWHEDHHEYSGMSPVPLSPFHSPGPFSTQKKVRLTSPTFFTDDVPSSTANTLQRKRRLTEIMPEN
jgi:hypothetical protein